MNFQDFLSGAEGAYTTYKNANKQQQSVPVVYSLPYGAVYDPNSGSYSDSGTGTAAGISSNTLLLVGIALSVLLLLKD